MDLDNCRLKQLEFQNTIARNYGISAVVYGEGKFVFAKKGIPQSTNLNFLDVCVERENRWKLVSTHYNQTT
jgi:hypothetical protein